MNALCALLAALFAYIVLSAGAAITYTEPPTAACGLHGQAQHVPC